ncbi:DNA-binding CsgD family transcriptional regulator [Arthrobacter sp. UYCu723]
MGVLQAYSKMSRQLDKLKSLIELHGTASRVPEPAPMPPRRARRLTEEQVAKIATEYESGKTVYEISKSLKVPRTMVSTHLARAGVITRHRPLTESQIDEAVRLYETGLSLARVGDRIGAAARTVQLRLRERGVQMRDSSGQACV